MDRYAVVGQPIAHSKSPLIHRFFANQLHQSMEYGTLSPKVDEFEGCVKDFFSQGGKGLNITLPFKERAYRMADRPSDRASMAQAANTLWFREGKIFADNTDGLGLLADFNFCGIPVEGQNVLIFGAGGAVRGVMAPLIKAKPLSIFIVNRTPEKAQELVTQFAELEKKTVLLSGGMDDSRLSKSFDVVINAMSGSLNGQSILYPSGVFSEESCVYDMVYGAGLTEFLLQAKTLGVKKYFDGLGMLIEQAAESFNIWRHCRPNTSELRPILRQGLGENK